MNRAFAGLLITASLTGSRLVAAPPGPTGVSAVILGTAQDAGVPQANCRCDTCRQAAANPQERRFAASLAVLDGLSQSSYLIDATPDFREQIALLADDPLVPLGAGRTPLQGIFLTHAHVGHYAGLIHLGREAMSASNLPVYCSARMASFLAGNGPWSQLVSTSQICLEAFTVDRPFALSPRVRVTALAVPHRDEFSDTVGFLIEGPSRKLLWLPDIDKWERWDRSLPALLEAVDYAFLDATFFSERELPDRKLSEIPHPLVTETIALLAGSGPRRAEVWLIHLNHSNPLMGVDATARSQIEAAGIQVAREGMRFDL